MGNCAHTLLQTDLERQQSQIYLNGRLRVQSQFGRSKLSTILRLHLLNTSVTFHCLCAFVVPLATILLGYHNAHSNPCLLLAFDL
jgi:hypothetical protein